MADVSIIFVGCSAAWDTSTLLDIVFALSRLHRHVSRLRRLLRAQVQVFAIEDAHEQIDHAMATAIREQKPCVLHRWLHRWSLPQRGVQAYV